MMIARRRFLELAALGSTGLALRTQSVSAETASLTGLPYTAREIAGRLGISMSVYSKERLGARHVAAIRAAGISRIELLLMAETFDCRDGAQVAEVLQECRRQEVAVIAVHADLRQKYDDPVETRRRAAAARLLEEMRFAEQAGADIVVAHLGTNDQSHKTVTELLERSEKLRVRLTVENMRGGLQPYADFVDRIGSNRFGITVDIGHARDPDGINPFVKPGRAQAVFAVAGRRVWHLHLHDTFRLKTKPDHRAPLHADGIIQWGEVFAALKAIDYHGVFLFEDGRGEEPEAWTRLAAAFPENFAKRYGK